LLPQFRWCRERLPLWATVKRITKEKYGDGDKDNKLLTKGKHQEKAKTMVTKDIIQRHINQQAC
jgi:hypothetical protein